MYNVCITHEYTRYTVLYNNPFYTVPGIGGAVTPNFVLPGNGPADLIRLPEMVRRTKSSCLKWSTGPFQAVLNGPTLPVLVR